MDLVEVRDRIASGELSSAEVTEATLLQADRFAASHNLFTSYAPELARRMARVADDAFAGGQLLGPLHGVPIGIKDNIDVAGLPGSAGTAVLKDRIAERDATAVARLREAGAVFFGKLNMHEMALGGTSANMHYGPVRNPWDPERIPGGSSGASAAAVSLGVCAAALGTDAGGSVRMPAAYCGQVGLKQTHGLVSLAGLMPTGTQHVDHIGPHTRTVADARLMLEVMAGYDEDDVHSSPRAAEVSDALTDLAAIRVGVPEAYFWEDLDTEVEAACRAALQTMEAAGAEIVPLALDISSYMPAVRAAMSAEAFVYHEPMITAQPGLYSPDLRARILAGQFVLAHDYVRAMRARRLLIESVRSTFTSVDVMAMPTVPMKQFRIDEIPMLDPVSSALMHLGKNTSPFNQTGTPAISIPVGLTSEGLPVGFQLAGPAFADYRLLAIAECVEAAVAFDTTPPVVATPVAA